MKVFLRNLIGLFLYGLIVFLLAALTGCGNLRFAASESQKQIAFAAHQSALSVNDVGSQPHSAAAGHLVQGTAAALAYIGMPASPKIEDYSATADEAAADAVRRPTAGDVFDLAEGGLSLAAELAILFGVGGAGVGGKKVIDWIKLSRSKSKALKEIVQGNELLTKYLRDHGKTDELSVFKAGQKSIQSEQTELLVAAERIPMSRQVIKVEPTPETS